MQDKTDNISSYLPVTGNEYVLEVLCTSKSSGQDGLLMNLTFKKEVTPMLQKLRKYKRKKHHNSTYEVSKS